MTSPSRTAPRPAIAYGEQPLPGGVRSRQVDGVNGLSMHVLEAGHDAGDRPRLLLLHGFPELAYSWRRVLPELAAAGYRVLAPDQRGYGRTTGWDPRYDGDVSSFRMANLVRDAIGLLFALGVPHVAGVIGHDFGAPVAAWCALLRPDLFRSAVLMSAPFAGAPTLPQGNAAAAPQPPDIHRALAALPRPRKHYQRYYGTPAADADMRHGAQGLHAFLRAYYHCKSADWPHNRPHRLAAWSAEQLALLPTYYVMDLDRDMAQTVAPGMPGPAQVAGCRWLPDDELAVYSAEFGRTGFQGGLNWYRCAADARVVAEQQTFSGRTIDVPSCFIAGRSDWGPFQRPGDLERMQHEACTRFDGCAWVDAAGHWVQQEQPEAVTRLLLAFLRRHAP